MSEAHGVSIRLTLSAVPGVLQLASWLANIVMHIKDQTALRNDCFVHRLLEYRRSSGGGIVAELLGPVKENS